MTLRVENIGTSSRGTGAGSASSTGEQASPEGSTLTTIFNETLTTVTPAKADQKEEGPISSMPGELLTNVQKYLNEPKDSGALARTSTRHCVENDPCGAAMGRFLDKVEEGIPVSFQEFKELKQLREFHGLKFSCTKPFTLRLSISQFTDDELQGILADFPNVEIPMNVGDIMMAAIRPNFPRAIRIRLNCPNAKFSDDVLKDIIQAFPNIIEIDAFDCSGITDLAVQYLTKLPSLASLHLRNSQITNSGLALLTTLDNLTSLGLALSDQITDEGLVHLSGLPRLENLHLSDRTINRTSLASLATLANLHSLKLSRCKFTDGLAPLASLKNLISLDLTRSYEVWDITPEELQDLSKLPRLTNLNLTKVFLETSTVESLATLENLTSLNLTNCGIDDNSLPYLATMKNLTSLCLDKNEDCTHVGLGFLAKLPNLTTLSLFDCKITNQALQVIATLKNLICLDLTGSDEISDEGLHHLGAMSNLKYLRLGACEQITSNGIMFLKRTLKNLTHISLKVAYSNRG